MNRPASPEVTIKNLLQFTVLAILLMAGTVVYAQKNRKGGFPPKYLLVQLPTEVNRLEALIKARRYAEVEEVEKDAIAVRQAMINDFTDHWSFCPVVYYMDTNRLKVGAQDFAGILLDKEQNPLPNSPVKQGDTDYIVVHYGRAAVQPRRTKVVKDEHKYEYDAGEPFGKGLIASNYKLQQVKYYVVNDYAAVFLSGRKRRKYSYESKHFQIQYFPLAKDMQQSVPYIYE